MTQLSGYGEIVQGQISEGRVNQPEPFTSDELASTLDRLQEASHYAQWVGGLIVPHLRGSVLEIGAGIGTLSDQIAPLADSLHLCEPHKESFLKLNLKYSEEAHISVSAHSIEEVHTLGRFDTIIMVNVLEHIDNDHEAINELHRLLNPGGKLILFVPAFQGLYSKFDAQIGHHRRYRSRTLKELFDSRRWHVDTLHYVNAPGFFLWWLGMRVLGMSPATSSLTTLFDRLAVPIIRRVESLVTPPLGQSLFCVAQCHTSSTGN